MKNSITKIRIAKCLFVALISFLTFSNSFSQYQERSYNLKCDVNSAMDQGRSIINRLDGGYAIGGYSYASGCGIGVFDWMLLRVKSNGVQQSVRLTGTLTDDRCYSLIQSKTDSGYVLAGNMFDASRNRATLVKFNKSSSLSYSKRLNDSLNSQYMQIIADSNTNWGLTGWTQRSITGVGTPNKFIATQYNSSGIKNWGYRYDSYATSTAISTSSEEAYSICYQPNTTAAGTPYYCVASRTDFYSGMSGKYDILLVKLSYTGAVIWKKVYRFNFPNPNSYPSAEPRKVIPMPDGGFAVVGSTNAYETNGSDVIVFRVSANGLLMWSHTYGTTSALEFGNSIILDKEHLVITGERRIGNNSPNAFLMKIPFTGGPQTWTRIWDATNPGSETGFDLVNSTVSAPDGYAITGDTYRGANLSDPFLWRTNPNGILPVVNCQDSIMFNCLTNPHRLDSFKIVRVSIPDKKWTPSVAQPNRETNTICLSPGADQTEPENELELDNIEEEIQFSLKQNYPNPFNPVTNIMYEIPAESFVKIKVFDIAGREVLELVNEKKARGRYEVRFDGSNLSTGAYYYKITAGNYNDIKKMMLIK